MGTLPTRTSKRLPPPRRPAWSSATQEDVFQYTGELEVRLDTLVPPSSLHCQDPKCSDLNHSKERDSFVLDILCNIVESSYTTLPMTGGRQRVGAGHGSRGRLPGWEHEVEPFRQQSLYWQNVWLKEGRPSHGWLHSTMVKRRTQYHHAVRILKRRLDLIRAKKLFEASLQGDINLLKEMKSIKAGK